MTDATSSDKSTRTALIAGATGLVGSELLQNLLSSDRYDEVISIGRSALDINHPKLKNEVVDLGDFPQASEKFCADDVYCCLGTTIKKAGSQENFKRVDYTFVMNVAKQAEACKAGRLMVVSAIGADADSGVFYSKVKGEVERDLKKLSIPEIHIFQPSLLLGPRKEFRFGERIAAGLMWLTQPFFRGSLSRYRAIPASKVARAMYHAAFQNKVGIHRYEYAGMDELVKSNVD